MELFVMQAEIVDPLSLANLRDPAILANPYPLYGRIRSQEPVRWDAPLECWVLTRYADIAPLLADKRMSSRRFDRKTLRERPGYARLEQMYEMVMKMLVYMDAPDHTRLRNLVARSFTPRVVQTLRARVAVVVDELLDAVEIDGRMDAIADFAYPLTTILIAELLGVPRPYWKQLKQWEDDLSGLLGRVDPGEADIEAAANSVQGYVEYFRGLMAERRERPGDDLLTSILAAKDERGYLSEIEVFSTCQLLMMAGHAAATHLISNGIMTLAQHPEHAEQLRADPSLLPAAVDELARFNTSAQLVMRIASEDMRVAGIEIRQGQVVRMVLGAAHHDPERFPDPERLDFTRDLRQALLYGGGPHICLGAYLARLEAELAYGGLLRRFDDLQIAGEQLRWLPLHSLHGVAELPITFTRRGCATSSGAAA